MHSLIACHRSKITCSLFVSGTFHVAIVQGEEIPTGNLPSVQKMTRAFGHVRKINALTKLTLPKLPGLAPPVKLHYFPASKSLFSRFVTSIQIS
jgi:hypothetical protein